MTNPTGPNSSPLYSNSCRIPTELLDEIPAFEDFLYNIGFKRNEGAIFGLLVLSEGPLSSEEIESILNLSQSAVSQGLKKLSLYGAIETRESRSSETTKRIKLHHAKEDALTIVATLFRKREQETIEKFKKMAQRVESKKSTDKDSVVLGRMKSIISTCELAESVIHFVLGVASQVDNPLYQELTSSLPRMLERNLKRLNDFTHDNKDNLQKISQLISDGLGQNLKEKLPENLSQNFPQNLKEKFLKLTGDHHGNK